MAECKSIELIRKGCGLKDWASFWEPEAEV